MRSFNFVLLGFAAVAAAQSLSQLPTCATTCALGAIGSTGCAMTDAACICKATGFLSGVQTCITTACNAADQQNTIAFAQSFCSSAGVPLSLPASPAATPAATGAASVSSARPVTSTSAASVSLTRSGTLAGPTSSALNSAGMPRPSTYTGAASAVEMRFGVMGALALGAAALL